MLDQDQPCLPTSTKRGAVHEEVIHLIAALTNEFAVTKS